MIQANELRIGNELFNGKVVSLPDGDVIVNDGYQDWKQSKLVDGFTPIPLTEEILLKCGFEYVKEIMAYACEKHCYFFIENGLIEFHPFCTNDSDCFLRIKHLHQLQNLYFALANEELSITL